MPTDLSVSSCRGPDTRPIAVPAPAPPTTRNSFHWIQFFHSLPRPVRLSIYLSASSRPWRRWVIRFLRAAHADLPRDATGGLAAPVRAPAFVQDTSNARPLN